MNIETRMGDATDRPVILWDCDDSAEQLNYSTKKVAIEAHLDGREQWDGTVTVYGYARMIVPKPTMDDAVELVENWFEYRWEEYIGEDGPDTPDSTVEAAHKFLIVMHKEFVPWACEVVTSEEVNVAAWVAENRPNRLDSK